MIGEIIGGGYREGAFGNEALDQNSASFADQVEYGVAFAKMAAVLAVGLTGGDVNTAAFAAENAARYNALSFVFDGLSSTLHAMEDGETPENDALNTGSQTNHTAHTSTEYGLQNREDLPPTVLERPDLYTGGHSPVTTAFGTAMTSYATAYEQYLQNKDSLSPMASHNMAKTLLATQQILMKMGTVAHRHVQNSIDVARTTWTIDRLRSDGLVLMEGLVNGVIVPGQEAQQWAHSVCASHLDPGSMACTAFGNLSRDLGYLSGILMTSLQLPRGGLKKGSQNIQPREKITTSAKSPTLQASNSHQLPTVKTTTLESNTEIVHSDYWNKRTDFKGNRVYQRDDLIDPTRMDASGRTNLDRMKVGHAPIGPDNKPIELHHMLQTQDGAIAEVTYDFHKSNKKIIHINPSNIPSGIHRPTHDKWRISYWKNRANDF